MGFGLAAAVSAALLVARRRYRRGYQPGSGRRDDLPVAPVVYELRLAHLRAQHHEEDFGDEDLDDNHDNRDDKGDQRAENAAAAVAPMLVVGGTTNRAQRPVGGIRATAPPLGMRDGREIALDLAAARGLGLVGDGGLAAARALVIAAITSPTTTATPATGPRARRPAAWMSPRVLVPAGDLTAVLGHAPSDSPHTDPLPAALRVVSSLEDALEDLEAETLARARTRDADRDRGEVGQPVVVLVARPAPQLRRRLQAVLDNGSTLGILGILLGQWQPGVTAYVRDDGTISATSPGLGEALRGTSVFRIGADDTADLLALLHRAQPQTPPSHDDPPWCPPQHRPRAPAPRSPITVASVSLTSLADTDLEILKPQHTPPPSAQPRRTMTAAPRAVPRPALAPAVAAPVDPVSPATRDTNGEQDPGEGDPSASSDGEDATGAPVLRITTLGPPRVLWRPEPGGDPEEITGVFQPRTRELVLFLAVHPEGVTREALVAALWPRRPLEKTTNALGTALSRLRRAVTRATGGALTDITVTGQGRYQLDPTLIECDYWRFAAAVAARRHSSTEHDRIDADRAIVASYRGPFADGLSTEWIESAREDTRRDALDAVAALARALALEDPHQTLDLLEVARTGDPHNEALYRDIMRLQHLLGHLDAIPRTLTLLTTRLAEIGDSPTDDAIGLAARLQQHPRDEPSQTPPPDDHGHQRHRSAR